MHRPAAALHLDDPRADDVASVGVAAAALARARALGVPTAAAAVLTTHWHPSDLRTAVAVWREVSCDGTVDVVVRSSGAAGAPCTSVPDVRGVVAFLDAVEAVLASGAGATAVLVQAMATSPSAAPLPARRELVGAGR